MSNTPGSLCDLLTGFRGPKEGYKVAAAFRKIFPEAEENGVAVSGGNCTLAFKIGRFDNQGVMQNPDAAVFFDRNKKGRWELAHFYMRHDYLDSEGPRGHLIDIDTALSREMNPVHRACRFIDEKAKGETFCDAVFNADQMGYISFFIESFHDGFHKGQFKAEIINIQPAYSSSNTKASPEKVFVPV